MIDLIINEKLFHPKTFACILTLVKIGDEVQTLDGVNHIESRKLKRQISASWIDLSRVELSRLLQTVYSGAYLNVTYQDPITNITQTRVFILQNNPSIPIKIWKNHLQYYEGTSIELLEKGAE